MKCPGRLIHYLNKPDVDKFKETKSHTHVGDARIFGRAVAINTMKRKAEDSHMYGRNVIAKVSENLDAATAATLPRTKSLLQTIRRVRTNTNVERLATNLTDLVIAEKFTKVKEEPFLLYDSGPGDDRILIFSTERNLRYLSAADVMLMDGTFSIVPPMFEQLYTLQGNCQMLDHC